MLQHLVELTRGGCAPRGQNTVKTYVVTSPAISDQLNIWIIIGQHAVEDFVLEGSEERVGKPLSPRDQCSK